MYPLNNFEALSRAEKKDVYRAVLTGQAVEPKHADAAAQLAWWLAKMLEPLAWPVSVLAVLMWGIVWFAPDPRVLWFSLATLLALMAAGLQFVMRRARKGYEANVHESPSAQKPGGRTAR